MRLTRLFLIAACLGPVSGSAAIVSYDSFESYTAGAQFEDGANGSAGIGLDGGLGWGGAYDVNNAFKSLVRVEDRTTLPVLYSNGEISLDGGIRALRVFDNANGTFLVRRQLGQTFDTSAAVYFSFLFRTNNSSPLTAQDFFQVGLDDALSGNPRTSIGANTLAPTGTQPFRFFARTTVTAANSTFDNTTDIVTSTTYMLVGKVTGTGTNFNRVDLFVNPSTLAEPVPSATFTLDSGIASFDHLLIRTAALDAGDAYVMDELRVATDYASVIPEPGTAMLMLAGISALVCMRRPRVAGK